MNRRAVIVGAGSVGLASLAGCTDVLGDDLTSFEASPAGVAQSAREETGYERTSVDETTVERTYEVAGQSETVTVTNYLTEHEKGIDLSPIGRLRGAVFVVLTTPQIRVLGEEFNPIEEMSTDDLVDLVGENYDRMGSPRHDGDETVTILDQETTRSRYAAEARFDGVDVEVDLHITEAVETEEDWLVTVGVYPRQLRAVEEGNVVALMEAVVEEAEDGGGSDGNESDGGE